MTSLSASGHLLYCGNCQSAVGFVHSINLKQSLKSHNWTSETQSSNVLRFIALRINWTFWLVEHTQTLWDPDDPARTHHWGRNSANLDNPTVFLMFNILQPLNNLLYTKFGKNRLNFWKFFFFNIDLCAIFCWLAWIVPFKNYHKMKNINN